MQGNSLTRLIYNQNPFYLISAGVVLYGVHTSVAVEPGEWVNYWVLAAVLAISVAVMAITAFCIVHFGKVWDDARTIFMVIFLLLFALSVSLDELCTFNTNLALAMVTSLFAFSVLVSEGLLRSLRIQFGRQFRIPYYLILGLTFFYPLVFSRDAIWYGNVNATTLLILFPVIGATLLLTLLPAVRQGSRLVTKNGTPWEWPLFPWSIFVLMTVGLIGRAYLLCGAFDPSHGSASIWGAFFLAPFLIAISIIVLEIGVREKLWFVCQIAMCLGVLALPLCIVIGPGWQTELFLRTMMHSIGSPVWLCGLTLVGVFAYAWSQNIEGSGVWLVLVLFLNVFIHPDCYSLTTSEPTSWPIALFSGYGLWTGIQQKRCGRFMAGAGGVAFGLAIALESIGEKELALPLAAHALIFLALFAGWHFRDRMASQLNAILAGNLVAIGFLMLVAGWSDSVPVALVFLELAVLVSLTLIGFVLNRDRLFGLAALIISAQAAIFAVPILVDRMANANDKRLVGFLLAAVGCFLLGVFISSLKAGMSRHFALMGARFYEDLKARFGGGSLPQEVGMTEGGST